MESTNKVRVVIEFDATETQAGDLPDVMEDMTQFFSTVVREAEYETVRISRSRGENFVSTVRVEHCASRLA